jgi:two-component system sensor histidine kinase ChiS
VVNNIITENGFQIGSAMELILFSIALADRINILKKEKEIAQAEALENQKLAIENLKKADKIKDEFLANTSHELRTPLNGIIGTVENLKEKCVECRQDIKDSAINTLNTISFTGRQLAHLLADILDYSRLKNKDLNLEIKAVNVYQIVDMLIELNNTHAASKNLELINQIPADFPLVRADENRLQQILQNLIGNALKFTDKGKITISGNTDNTNANIIVEDSGVGIAGKDLEKIFHSFEQADGSSVRPYGGTGLGLSITRNLVELLGGEIKADSIQGKGSRFSFKLPLADSDLLAYKSAEPDIFENDNIGANNQTADKNNLNIKLPLYGNNIVNITESDDKHLEGRPTILAVDDDPLNLQVIQDFLTMKDFNVLTAGGGAEALKKLEVSPLPDLILLDIMMPQISGYDVCRKIRQKEDEKFQAVSLPVILLTAKIQINDLLEGLNAGANDYITKPFEREELLFRINNLLLVKRFHKEKIKALEEKKSAVVSTKQNIFADLHDHLGANLTDIKLLSEKLESEVSLDKKLINLLNKNIDDAISIFRDRLLQQEDLEILLEDFFLGLQLILVRRYAATSRLVQYHVESKLKKRELRLFSEKKILELYSVITEIATNDLKYGTGKSDWDFTSLGNKLFIELKTSTIRSESERKRGTGLKNLKQRINELNGELLIKTMDNDKKGVNFYIKIIIPLEKQKNSLI